MQRKVIAVLPGGGPGKGDGGVIKQLLEPMLPDWIDARWWSCEQELHALAPDAEIGWFDMHYKPPLTEAVNLATGLKWLNSLFAGLDFLDLDAMHQRGIQLTNGSGLTDIQVSEFAVMGMLSVAKGYRDVIRAADRHEWLQIAPGTRDLAGSKALLLGFGAIGKRIARQLEGFEVEVVPVRRGGGADGSGSTLGPDEWRARLGEFDWVILVVPGTAETHGMIGKAELAAMKGSAVLVNYARANVVDQAALTEALRAGRIGAALLDVTDPEPLPADHPLWELPNAHITMHLSGRPTPQSLRRAVERFAQNCERYRKGDPLVPQFNGLLGY